MAGTPATFTIFAKDGEGVDQLAGGDDFLVSLSSAGGTMLTASISDLTNGTYTAYYTPTDAGVYNMAITLKGQHVAESPYKVHVFPTTTSPAHCAASGVGLVEIRH